MRIYLGLLSILIIDVIKNAHVNKSLKPYPNPHTTKLRTDLLLKQPTLSPYTFWVNIMESTWQKRSSYPKPFKIVFNLYDEGIVARVPGKTVQLSYEDIDYFWAKGIGDIILFTKLEKPIAVGVKVYGRNDVLGLLTSKGVKQK